MSLNGTVYELTAGHYHAQVASAGATLASLSHRGRPLLLGFDPRESLGVGFPGRTLAPWPNRVARASYVSGGKTLALDCNEPATGAALHGLVAFWPWACESARPEGVTLRLDLPGSPGYPFTLGLSASYRLDAESGLHVDVAATNIGRRDCPVGLGSHPYLTCGFVLDVCALSFPAVEVLDADEKMTPIGRRGVPGSEFDFVTPRQIASTRFDHAFAMPPGEWAVTLSAAEGGVRLASDAPWLQLYSADDPRLGRRGLAVEPMTCAPNAFNTDPGGVLLEPGRTRTLSFSIGVDTRPALRL